MNSPSAGGWPVPSEASTPTTTPATLLVDRRAAGRLLGMSPDTIYNWRTRGTLPSVKRLSRRLFDLADPRRYVEARTGVWA